MKVNFQICNAEAPNSVQNTCVFAAFEAPDSATNVRVATARYRDQVSDLAGSKWRYIHVYVVQDRQALTLCTSTHTETRQSVYSSVEITNSCV